MQVMLFFSIHPVGNGAHFAEDVARAVQIIRESGLQHELGPSGTTILGEWDDVMACLKACHESLLEDAPRVSSVIKVDLKAEGFGSDAIREKVQSVERLIAQR